MRDLIEMLRYRRPSFSATEQIFINKFIRPLGVTEDKFGNLMKVIGDEPNILWSCHTDTVHWEEGLQQVKVTNKHAMLPEKSKSNCLGADCTAGVWVMSEMIKANVPGLYVFHRDEENGGKGSSFIAKNTPDLLKDIDAAIAFDRFGTQSVITHQFSRCCSDDFADSLIEQLPGSKRDDEGLFTDTANYTEIVSECTNLSVGYNGHHSSREIQNMEFLGQLRDRMIKLDTSKLRFSRDPNTLEWQEWPARATTPKRYVSQFDYSPTRSKTLEQLIRENPAAVADLLEIYGLCAADVEEHIRESH